MGIPAIGKTTFGSQLEIYYATEGDSFFSSVSYDVLR